MATTHAIRPDILIHLRRVESPSLAGKVGLALAKRLGAWATGLHVVPVAPATMTSPEAVALYVGEADASYREAQGHAPAWRALLDAHRVDGDWQVSQGDVIDALALASRWSDLVVIERPQLDPDAPIGWGVVSRTILNASAPVVVVPETAACASVGERILVAWNHSREAALAIRGALPLLRLAGRVTVLEGTPAENPFGLRYLPKMDVREWLGRHGIDAQFKPFAPGKERGADLLAAAHAADADLIVMGAWGHSRITELVLGGTTRHMFQHSDLPLLVAH
jgi:nucleotide-binding universal stress UspA family protein